MDNNQAARHAMAQRVAGSPPYEPPTEYGLDAWRVAQEITNRQFPSFVNGDIPPPTAGDPPTERDPSDLAAAMDRALLGPAEGQSPAPGLPPPDPVPGGGTSSLGLDTDAIDRALRGVDGGPTLDDFTRLGTVPGFGDPNQDPHGVELRRRLTALLRSTK